MSAYRQTLQRLVAIQRALAGDVTLHGLAAELDDVLAVLDRQEHRADTLALAARVQRLDQQLRDRPAAERNDIIRQRLGISRSRLYELRAVRLSPDGEVL